MRKSSSLLVVGSALLAFAGTAGAQAQTAAKVDPGMSKAQVIEQLGKPSGESTRGEFTYLFFANGMEKTVGMSDLVMLQGDKVVDALFRSPRRTYTGTSSSPRAISAQEAAKKNPAAPKGGSSAP